MPALHLSLGRIAHHLLAVWLTGFLVAAAGCASPPSEAGVPGGIRETAQAVGTQPVGVVSCLSDAPCTMPLLAAGEGHSVAVKSDGTVWAWGYAEDGQLGYGGTDDSNVPVQVMVSPAARVGLSGIAAIAAGQDRTAALRVDGTVWEWGFNDYGALGGPSSPRPSPVQVMASPDAGLSGVSAVEGEDFTVALKADGTIWAWGSNGNGRLGDETDTDRWTPVKTHSYLYSLEACKTVPACSNGACAPKVCGGHGTCKLGTCACDASFLGSTCTECTADHYGYPACTTFCQAATTCSGRGACDATGACVCSSSSTTGFFGGASCDQCAADYYGDSTCTTHCTSLENCNDHGSCDEMGSCSCSAGFSGSSCDECATDGRSYGTYPDCRYCLASDTCNGHGACDSEGSCACSDGFAGAACDRCALGYSGYPDCVPVADAGTLVAADSGAAGGETPADPYSLIGCGCVAGGTAVDPLAILGLVGFLIARGAARKPHPPAPSP